MVSGDGQPSWWPGQPPELQALCSRLAKSINRMYDNLPAEQRGRGAGFIVRGDDAPMGGGEIRFCLPNEYLLGKLEGAALALGVPLQVEPSTRWPGRHTGNVKINIGYSRDYTVLQAATGLARAINAITPAEQQKIDIPGGAEARPRINPGGASRDGRS
jgi:hypothetical protein